MKATAQTQNMPRNQLPAIPFNKTAVIVSQAALIS
jgi:hypothetical protein